jgi:hypothetical protein
LSTQEEALGCVEIIRERGADIVFLDKHILSGDSEINVGDRVLRLIREAYPDLLVFGISHHQIEGAKNIGKQPGKMLEEIRKVEARVKE